MKTVLRFLVTLGTGIVFQLVVMFGNKVSAAQPDSSSLQFARKTLEFVEMSAKRPELAAELKKLEDKAATTIDKEALDAQVRQLRRRIIFSHPLLDFEKLLINKRPPPKSQYAHQNDQYYGRHSKAGPGLVILDSWKDTPKASPLLKNKLPKGSVLHPDLSFDGKRVIFSFCDHTVKKNDNVTITTHPRLESLGYNNDTIGRRRFHIFEATIDGQEVRQLTGTISDPMVRADNNETVLIEDLDPCYLPDGGFAFVSTRSQNFGRCHWGRYTPSFVLYRANAEGADIRQISFGEANEWDPSVLPDGRLIYTRWDYINRNNTWFQSLWVTKPDGTSTAHYYGNYTKNPCVIAEALAIPGSRKVVATATAHHFISAGSTIVIDPTKGQEGLEPLTRITPDVKFPETEGWDLKGCFTTPYPLSEDLFLVAYSPEKVKWHTENGGYSGSWPSDAAFGIYLIDKLGGRELIYRDPDVSCFAPIPIRPRPTPQVIPSVLPNPNEVEQTGTCYVQDVYRSTQTIPKGSIKYLRINQIHNQPAANHTQRNLAREEPVKSVIGTVPVNEDGSVAFKAPANVGFQLQALDENGMAIMTMRSMMYVQPGEVIGCIGCHEDRISAPNVSLSQKNSTIHTPKPLAGQDYEGGFSFMRTVQPVLDRYCIKCHGLSDKFSKEVNLISGKAYSSLTGAKGMVKIAYSNVETFYSKPKDYFAHAGKLAPMLIEGHSKLYLPKEDLERIVTWLDLNGQQYGDYSFNRIENRTASPEGEKALRKYIAECFGKELSEQPFEALVNVGEPKESRILKAPLAANAGGWEQIEKGWESTDDAGYKTMEKLVNASIIPLKYKDINGTCGRDTCICYSCWVRKLLHQDKPMGQSITIANFDQNKLYRINEQGEVIWEFDAKQCVDFEIYPNGNILFSDGKGVKIVTPDKKVILDYHAGGSEVWGCLFMPNGNILVGHNNESKVVEIDKIGNKVSEFGIVSKAGGHDVMREMTLTPQNTVLIGHKGDKVAREYNLKGNMINEFQCPDYVQHAKRLPNGNTLVTWKHGVWEFDKQKQVIWKLNKADVPEIGISWLIRSQRLPNGNTLISNWAIKEGKGHAIFMVDKEKKVVWKSPKSKIYNGTSSIFASIPENTNDE